MSAVSEPAPLDETTTLHAHATALFERYPDGPPPRGGRPYPDQAEHRARNRARRAAGSRGGQDNYRQRATHAADILVGYFSQPVDAARPEQWYHEFVKADAPIHRSPAIAEAAAAVEPARVRDLGRWLVLHSTDTEAAVLGLALLTEAGGAEDISLIQRIGLLSDTFGALAARALERLPDPVEPLIWLAERSAGWGRVYIVEALCRLAEPASFPWLLRRAIDGDFLNAYYAGKVATTAPVHEVIAGRSPDEEVIDHTGRLLLVLTYAHGMGGSLDTYAHARQVLLQYAHHAARLEPSAERYFTARILAEDLDAGSGSRLDWGPGELEGIRAAFHALLARPGWTAAVQRALDVGDGHQRHAAAWAATRLGITAHAPAHSSTRSDGDADD